MPLADFILWIAAALLGGRILVSASDAAHELTGAAVARVDPAQRLRKTEPVSFRRPRSAVPARVLRGLIATFPVRLTLLRRPVSAPACLGVPISSAPTLQNCRRLLFIEKSVQFGSRTAAPSSVVPENKRVISAIWETVPQIGTPIALVAFAIACATVAMRWITRRRIELLQVLPQDERHAALSTVLESLHVDISRLTPDQQYSIAVRMLRQRAERFKMTAQVGVVIAALFAAVVIIALLRPPDPGPPPPPPQLGPATQTNLVDSDFARLRVLPLEPQPNEVLDHYPRTVTFRWSALPAAVKYKLEVESKQGPEFMPASEFWDFHGQHFKIVTDTFYTSSMGGRGEYRWRVTGIDADGTESQSTGWLSFFFEQ